MMIVIFHDEPRNLNQYYLLKLILLPSDVGKNSCGCEEKIILWQTSEPDRQPDCLTSFNGLLYPLCCGTANMASKFQMVLVW